MGGKGEILLIMCEKERKYLRFEMPLKIFYHVKGFSILKNIVGWVWVENDLIYKYGLVMEEIFYITSHI